MTVSPSIDVSINEFERLEILYKPFRIIDSNRKYSSLEIRKLQLDFEKCVNVVERSAFKWTRYKICNLINGDLAISGGILIGFYHTTSDPLLYAGIGIIALGVLGILINRFTRKRPLLLSLFYQDEIALFKKIVAHSMYLPAADTRTMKDWFLLHNATEQLLKSKLTLAPPAIPLSLPLEAANENMLSSPTEINSSLGDSAFRSALSEDLSPPSPTDRKSPLEDSFQPVVSTEAININIP